MYLLNRDKISGAVRSRDDPDIRIGQFSDACLQHTYYYFRLGPETYIQNQQGDWVPQPGLTDTTPLQLDKGQCVRIRSLEDFALGERIMGIIGGNTDLALRGVTLLHGPFIDPLYPSSTAPDPSSTDADPVSAPLKMALVNHSAFLVTLPLRERIGKITFYDVSDTYPVDLDPDSLAARTFRERAEG
jgi:deoxycytidine triphosphate deaminase